ncbi:hypothetical protein BDZ90DRAFT_235043 [Jaminaea rosea]|uniref:Uncharacterized protein n=1 Tax=Jaminaea rosea TaxID=1569628 RepID=A0A316UKP6_9BASI|nr:hypothetical protein BDZ90DRAFT_235043 [Jaminaea rosea]PWN24503.1 hypothetical protein BDZ90DRAFT_235043 [Jaminaea rosea]
MRLATGLDDTRWEPRATREVAAVGVEVRIGCGRQTFFAHARHHISPRAHLSSCSRFPQSSIHHFATVPARPTPYVCQRSSSGGSKEDGRMIHELPPHRCVLSNASASCTSQSSKSPSLSPSSPRRWATICKNLPTADGSC